MAHRGAIFAIYRKRFPFFAMPFLAFRYAPMRYAVYAPCGFHFHAIATTIPRIIQNGTEIMSPMLSPLKTPSCLKRA